MSVSMVPGFYAVGDAATFPVAHDGQVFEVVQNSGRDAEAIA